MKINILLKKIRNSLSYSLLIKKSGIWGVLLFTYTILWILCVVFFLLIDIISMVEDILTSIILFIIMMPFIIPAYVPIYYAWSRKTDNFEIQKGMDVILHGENVIDGILGKVNKKVFGLDTDPTSMSSVVLTPTRILFYSKKVFGGNHSRDIELNNISDVTFKSGLLFDKIIFHTNDVDLKVSNITKDDLSKDFVDNVKLYISDLKNEKQRKIDQEKEVYDSIKLNIDVPNPLKLGMENPIKITIINPTEMPIFEIEIQSKISTLIKCAMTNSKIKTVQPKSSEYTAIFINPRIADKIDIGHINVSFKINGNIYEKEPIVIGTYEAIEVNSHKPESYTDSINSDLSISRETEFYQGFIRFKMSVTNNSSFVVNDVALDFDYDNNLLRIDRREPDYQIKNGRTIFGNISANSSKTISVYFDPMMCSKGTDINCQVNYKDAKGQPQTTHMEPKKISVVCPIIETESDINIGRLKEFIEKLPYRDSKVYQIQRGFDIDVLKNLSREIVQKHDVKHIRTLFTKDENTCEIWYYGKTKVHGHDIVIKITILSETQNIELFAATQTVESLAGLLAEVGRELKDAIESKVTGNVQQVINVSIKDSIVQRSNLLSHCDINGNCSGDVVIEDSLVTRSEIGLDSEIEESVVQKVDNSGGFCTACGEVVPDGAKFCNECGERLQ